MRSNEGCEGARRPFLIFAGQLGLGGAERELVTFLDGLGEGAREYRVACLNEGGVFRSPVEQLTRIKVESPGTNRRFRRLLWVRRLLLQHRPLLVHCWNLYPVIYLKLAFPSRPCPLIGFLQNIPAQTLDEGTSRFLLRLLVSTPDVLVSNSHKALAELPALGVQHPNTAVVHNGVSRAFFDAEASEEAMARRSASLVLIGVGRLINRKRVDWMIRSVADLRTQGLDVALWVVGDGPEMPACRMLADSLGVAEHVQFWGAREDAHEILPAADVFLHCAWAEGLPNVVQEAMVVGLPIIAPETSGIPEVVTHDQEGLLFPVDDFRSCVRAIRTVVVNREVRDRLAAAAAARAQRDFRPETMAAKMAELHRTTAQSGPSRWGRLGS